MKQQQNHFETLEAIIDRDGVASVLGMITEICQDKASQDNAWKHVAERVDVASDAAADAEC